jgi:hypothetical protein
MANAYRDDGNAGATPQIDIKDRRKMTPFVRVRIFWTRVISVEFRRMFEGGLLEGVPLFSWAP